jgi:cytochrome b
MLGAIFTKTRSTSMKSILVWDVPTRLFHWLFALTFVVAFVTAEAESRMVLHVYAGLVFAGLLAYRLVWGVIGSRYARFSSFLFGPVAAFRYLLDTLQGKAERHIGHNPAGSWAIYLLLLLGIGISVSGLFMLGAAGEQFEELHEALSYGALAIVVVHIVGVIVASRLHDENLPRAMVTGRKQGDEAQAIPSARPIAALALLVLLAAFSFAYWQGWDAQARSVTLPFLNQPLTFHEHGAEGGHHHDDDD